MSKWALAAVASLAAIPVVVFLARSPRPERSVAPLRVDAPAPANERHRGLGGEPGGTPAPPARRAVGDGTVGDGTGALSVTLEFGCTPVESVDIALVDADGEAHGSRRVTNARAEWNGLAPGAYGLEVGGGGFDLVRRRVTISADAEVAEIVPVTALNRLGGTAVDSETGVPLADFEARVQTRESGPIPSDRFFPWGPFSAGRFCLEGVPRVGDRMRVHVTARGYEPAVSDWLPLESFVDDLYVEVTPTALAIGIVEGRISSVVDGSGVADAHVVLVDSDASLGSVIILGSFILVSGVRDTGEEADPERDQALSGADGTFRVVTELPLSGKLVVHHVDYHLAESAPIETAAGKRTERVDVALKRGAFLRGRVLSAPDETPRIAGLEVHGPERMYFTDVAEDGTFRRGGLVDGAYQLRLNVLRGTAGGRETVALAASQLAVIEDGKDAEVTFHLGAGLVGTTIAGVVVLPSDPEIDHWMVAVADPRQAARGMITTTAPKDDGHFELDGVPNGDLALILAGWSPDFTHWAATSISIEVREGSGPSVTLDASSPRVDFELPDHDPESRPPRLSVTSHEGLFASAPGEEIVLRLDLEGRAVLYGLPPGEYTATLTGAGSEIPRGFTIPTANAPDLEIVLD